MIRLATYWRLGLANIWQVAWYRARLRLRVHPVQRIRAVLTGTHFFNPCKGAEDQESPAKTAKPQPLYFGWYGAAQLNEPPDWHCNPFTGAEFEGASLPWWKLSDFGSNIGDIKTVWEASRFDWALAFAEQARDGDQEALSRLNRWVADWVVANPPYKGPNWKCAQEASIRVIHLLVAARLMDQALDPRPELVQLVQAHLARIRPTLSYAMAQDNNHGTSEAAALFIGGSWLDRLGAEGAGQSAKLGRQWLENRAARLILEDGSFSQYSTNYHRLMLDTYCLAEYWRDYLNLPEFSTGLYARLAAAARWLFAMTQPETGDVPNLGANDGARLIPLGGTDYRDFRPAVQLGMALFANQSAYSEFGNWNGPLSALGIKIPTEEAPPVKSVQFDKGGFSVLRRGQAFTLLRYPRFRFRPSQADALHVDLWVNGTNRLRDAGSYSYNASQDVINYFQGTVGHNTVQFDGRDQMPRLKRFLFGAWLKPDRVEPITENADKVTTAAGYTDREGARHHREICLTTNFLQVKDNVFGFRKEAVLRWRLAPGAWQLQGNTISNGADSLKITASVPIDSLRLIEGWESRYYLRRTPVPVIEVKIQKPGCLISRYDFVK